MKYTSLLTATVLFGSLATLPAAPFERVSVDSEENQLMEGAYNGSVSGDGRFVVFLTFAAIAPNDTDVFPDVYVRDRDAGTTTLVSVNISGDAANDHCYRPLISDDGSSVCFSSEATDLVPGGGNGNRHVYHRILSEGVTTRISVSNDGDEGNGRSSFYDISRTGEVMVFDSQATNLVPEDTDTDLDVFAVKVGDPSSITLVSVGVTPDNAYGEQPKISADGRFVAFYAEDDNLVAGVSDDLYYIFRRDLELGTTILVSKTPTGEEPNGESYDISISADGRFVTYRSQATNIHPDDTDRNFDIYLYDAMEDRTTLVSKNTAGIKANSGSGVANNSISDDGRYIVFDTDADNLTSFPDTGLQSYVHDRILGTTELVSKRLSGEPRSNDISTSPTISADGEVIVFSSSATDLVDDDTNGQRDIFLTQRPDGVPLPTANPSNAAVDNAAAKASLLKKIKKLKKKMKAAKRRKQVAKVKRFKKKIKKLTKRLRIL